MALLPKVLFALMLLLPGGFVVGPVVLLLKRWRERRASQPQSIVKTVAPQLPRETHPIEPTRIAA
jgi:hypothetical protein